MTLPHDEITNDENASLQQPAQEDQVSLDEEIVQNLPDSQEPQILETSQESEGAEITDTHKTDDDGADNSEVEVPDSEKSHEQSEEVPVSSDNEDNQVKTEQIDEPGDIKEADIESPDRGSDEEIGDNDNTKITLEIIKKDERREDPEENVNRQVLNQGKLDKIREVFVPSMDYVNKEHNLADITWNLVVIYGRENAGKFTTALQICMDIYQRRGKSGNPEVTILNLGQNVLPWSLLNYLSGERAPNNAFFIFRDCFDDFPQLYDRLIKHYQEELNNCLKSKGSYLILTTQRNETAMEELVFPKVNAEVENLEAVFFKHLTYFKKPIETRALDEKVANTASEHWQSLSTFLTTPTRINRFCRKLADVAPISVNKERLDKLAREASHIIEVSTREWFSKSLDANHKIYAMLVVLLRTIGRRDIDVIYSATINRLVESGVRNLYDTRECGITDLLETIHCSESESEMVSFEERIYHEEAFHQIKNHHHLLWSVSDILIDVIDDFKNAEHWALRRDLGAAIGLLGVFDRTKYEKILATLAQNSHNSVVAVAGYAMAESVRRNQDFIPWTIELLKTWSRSRDPDLMWAASSSCWRVYESLCRSLEEGTPKQQKIIEAKKHCLDALEYILKSAGTFDSNLINIKRAELNKYLQPSKASKVLRDLCFKWFIQNLGGALFALQRITHMDAAMAVGRLTAWLEGEDLGLAHQARLCIAQYFDFLRDFSSEPIVEAYKPLLKLVSPFFEHGQSDNLGIDDFLITLARWTQWSQWERVIEEHLLIFLNRASCTAIRSLISGLSRIWMIESETRPLELGQRLIVHGNCLLGYPVFPEEEAEAILAIDLSPRALQRHRSMDIGRALYHILRTNMCIQVIGLGQGKSFNPGVQNPDSRWVPPTYPHSPLLFPALEATLRKEPVLLIILTWANVIDLDDSLDSSWANRLMVVTSSKRSSFPEWVKTICIKKTDPNELVLATLDRAHRHLLHLIANGDLTSWHKYFPGVLTGKSGSIHQKMEELVKGLDTLDKSEQTRQLSELFLILNNQFPDKSIDLAIGWMKDSNELKQQMGRAFGLLVFRLCTERNPKELAHDKLNDLRYALSRFEDSLIIVTQLVAWREWLKSSPVWSETVLDGVGSAGNHWRCFARSLTISKAQHMEEIPTFLDAFLGDDKGKLGVLTRAQASLKWYLTLNSPDLSETPKSGNHGILIVDTRLSPYVIQAMSLFFDQFFEFYWKQQRSMPLLVYRMGQAEPVAFLEGDSEHHAFSLPPFTARLVGPILHSHRCVNAAFVLILSGGNILDLSDWNSPHWNELLFHYGFTENSHPSDYVNKLDHLSPNEIVKQLVRRFD